MATQQLNRRVPIVPTPAPVKLLPQIRHFVLDHRCVATAHRDAHSREFAQLAGAENLALMANQRNEKAISGRTQFDGLPLECDLLVGEVQSQRTVVEDSGWSQEVFKVHRRQGYAVPRPGGWDTFPGLGSP
jgi:hypothetical protein